MTTWPLGLFTSGNQSSKKEVPLLVGETESIKRKLVCYLKVFLPPTNQFWHHWVSYNPTQLLHYLSELVSDFTCLRTHPIRLLPFEMPIGSIGSLGYPWFCPTQSQSWGFLPISTLLSFNNLPGWLIELRKIRYLLLQFVIIDMNKQLDEKAHKAVFRGILNAGASVPMELGRTTLPVRVHVQTQKLPKSQH